MAFPWSIATVFEIISIGDAELLAQAFNGLAAITNSAGFGSMTRVAFMVGILAFAFRAFMTNRFELTPLLAGLIVYIAMFGPRASVVVIDAYSGQARAVANVPIGLAAPFSLVSTMGRYFAGTFETAFAVIGPDNDFLGAGYLDSLSILLRMRDVELAYANSPDAAKNSDIHTSINNYLVSCVYYDLMLDNSMSANQVTIEKIRRAENTWSALETKFTNIHTVLYLPGGSPSGQPYNCKNAYEVLSLNYINPASPYFTTVLSPWIKSVMQKPLNAEVPATDRLQGALNSIGLSAQNAQNYALNAFISTILRRADMNFAMSRQDVAAAITTSQALSQRNVQWSSEKTMFEKVARPVTAFIEVFLVAATPLMAFAIAAFGLHGFSTLGKFMLMHFWVTLWAPTLAIANMYIYTRVNRYVEYIAAQMADPQFAVSPISVLGMDTITEQLQTEFATGSMLAAATPMLTLMLIYGSSQVASMLANKMSSVQEADPKIASPSVMTSAPYYRADSVTNGNPFQALQVTGAAAPSISIGQTGVANRTAAENFSQTSSRGFNEALSSAYGRTEQGSQALSFEHGKGFRTADSSTSTKSTGFSMISSAISQSGASTTEQQRLAQTMSGAATVSGGFGFGLPELLGKALSQASKSGSPFKLDVGAKASAAEQLSKQAGVSYQAAEGFINSLTSQMQTSQTQAASYMKEYDSSGRLSDRMAYTASDQYAASKQVGQTLGQALVASRVASESDATVRTFGTHTTSTPGQLYSNAKGTAGGEDKAAMAVDRAWGQSFGGDTGKQKEALGQWLSLQENRNSLQGLNAGEATTAAKLAIMAGDGRSNATHLLAREGLAGSNMGGDYANFRSSAANDDLKGIVGVATQGANHLQSAYASELQMANDKSSASENKVAAAQARGGEIAASVKEGHGSAPGEAARAAVDAAEGGYRASHEQSAAERKDTPAQKARNSGLSPQGGVPHQAARRAAALTEDIEDGLSSFGLGAAPGRVQRILPEREDSDSPKSTGDGGPKRMQPQGSW